MAEPRRRAARETTGATRQVTMDDVAREAGVSVATVSNALLGRGRMLDSTRTRVLGIAARMNYTVNQNARNLRTARAGAIGVHLPENKSGLAYYMDFCFGVVDVAEEHSLAVTLIPGGRPEVALRAQVDGFVLVDPPVGDVVVEAILTTGKAVVSGDGTPPGLPEPSGLVASDHRAGIRAVLEHLTERGARRVALISAGRSARWSADVEDAYLEWSSEHDREPIVVGGSRLVDAATVESLTDSLLDGPKPDAIVAVPMDAAVGVVSVARDRGLDVGSELLVAGYTDSPSLSVSIPPITAVDAAPREFGRACARMLVRQLADADRPVPGEVESFPIAFVERASTRGARVE
ncbi:LacI family DNA-binding transcriptional regulator [Agromyces silvae]|uniref:LacI family DNA-binding transcriptional regulator n=1 Tax=Agromyces silvae TaxID=3388266 RepID=UPI00280AA4BD|nr:LacI family DNA-binding transcriptional regulator [Agromyces protaetiae]